MVVTSAGHKRSVPLGLRWLRSSHQVFRELWQSSILARGVQHQLVLSLTPRNLKLDTKIHGQSPKTKTNRWSHPQITNRDCFSSQVSLLSRAPPRLMIHKRTTPSLPPQLLLRKLTKTGHFLRLPTRAKFYRHDLAPLCAAAQFSDQRTNVPWGSTA